MNAALLWKEWREQRWRLVLGTLVLTAISASLVRAQLIPTAESVVLVFGPLGLLLAVFLAMGSVATERQDGTWAFLVAQPVRPATILRIKWLIGALNLLVALLLAAVSAHLMAVSRGVFVQPDIPAYVAKTLPDAYTVTNSPAWLWACVVQSSAALLGWYTVLFFILTRARNELHAGLGGIVLTIGVLAWGLQLVVSKGVEDPAVAHMLRYSALLDPLSPLLFVFESLLWRLAALGVALVVWTIGPVWLVGRLRLLGRQG